jgi:O-antigen/teichoic acid export membrane protein
MPLGVGSEALLLKSILSIRRAAISQVSNDLIYVPAFFWFVHKLCNDLMALRNNVIANYSSQIYVTAIGIILVPVYIDFMGAEAYGLVAFYALLQSWLSMLDMGLSPTIARETARFKGGAMLPSEYYRLVNVMQSIFLLVALLSGGTLYFSSSLVAQSWLKSSEFSNFELTEIIQLFAVIIAFRLICGLYRGMLIGAQRLIWLSGFNAAVASFRFLGVIPILMFVSVSPKAFFYFQLAVALVEICGLYLVATRLVPNINKLEVLRWEWDPLKPVVKFSLSVAFTTLVWVLVTQTDKLILSKLLSLTDYGYFSLAVLVASGIMLLSAPVSSAIMPLMAKLEAEGNQKGLIRVYSQMTQLVVVLAGSAAITIAFHADALLLAWTGNTYLVSQAAPVLVLYAIGNGILAVSAFPYYLQYAKGDLRLHMLGNAIFVLLLVPLIIWATANFGVMGAGYVWLTVNLLTFVLWLPFVHWRFAPGINVRWYGRDVARIIIPAICVGWLTDYFLPDSTNRGILFSEIIFSGLLILFTSAIASSEIRKKLLNFALVLYDKTRAFV